MDYIFLIIAILLEIPVKFYEFIANKFNNLKSNLQNKDDDLDL